MDHLKPGDVSKNRNQQFSKMIQPCADPTGVASTFQSFLDLYGEVATCRVPCFLGFQHLEAPPDRMHGSP